ncbi:hypothetical protein Bbelb_334820 [Branchiostoma belcheri]|nr:hypothetical protein Bbelb_334820 [Branchiostoma belcheri]
MATQAGSQGTVGSSWEKNGRNFTEKSAGYRSVVDPRVTLPCLRCPHVERSSPDPGISGFPGLLMVTGISPEIQSRVEEGAKHQCFRQTAAERPSSWEGPGREN